MQKGFLGSNDSTARLAPVKVDKSVVVVAPILRQKQRRDIDHLLEVAQEGESFELDHVFSALGEFGSSIRT